MSTENTIVLKAHGGHHDEAVTDEICSPGHAVELAADGKLDLQQAAVGEAIKSELLIVKEDALQGKSVADAYAVADQVFFYIPRAGDVINLLVKSGQTILVADDIVVEGGGSGLFIKAAGTETRYQAKSLEDSGGALGANTLIQCRVL